eukprot:gene23971-30257_t
MLVDVDHTSKNVMITLYRFAPASVMAVVPLALSMELPRLLRSTFALRLHRAMLVETLSLATVGGVISLLLIAVEVRLLQLTSSLSMGVLGQTKEILQILIAMAIYKDAISVRSAAGITVSIMASFYYKHLKSSASATATPPSDNITQDEDTCSLVTTVDQQEGTDDGEVADDAEVGLMLVKATVLLDRKAMSPMHITTR